MPPCSDLPREGRAATVHQHALLRAHRRVDRFTEADFPGIYVSTRLAVGWSVETIMTSSFRINILAAGIVHLAGVYNASAQVENQLDFTTSFAFTVGNATVPAGHYTITPVEDDPWVLELKGGRTSVLIETQRATPKEVPSKNEIVFQRYGDRYVLKNIWTEGSDTGYVTEPAAREWQISRHHGGAPGESRVAAHKKPRREV